MEQPVKTAYSKDGYIVDQARTKHIRYGLFSSDFNGCGWIAEFNMLRRFGSGAAEQDLANELIRYTVFRGLAGTDLFRLQRTLRRRGYRMPLKFAWNKKARLPKGTNAGIIYYCHKDGFHFVTFYADESIQPDASGEPRYRFLNAIAGKENHFDTMRGFLTRHNVIPFALILVWPGKAATQPSENPAASD